VGRKPAPLLGPGWVGLPRALPNNITFKTFSKLIRRQRLEKIETALAISSPSQGFRDGLIAALWRFYCNSGSHVWNSRAFLKRKLRESAQLATKLKTSANFLSQSQDPDVLELLNELVRWQPWQLSQPMHESGIPLIGLLDELAKRTSRFENKLRIDRGGRREDMAFDELLVGLATQYRILHRERNQPLDGTKFVEFAWAVTGILHSVRAQLPKVPSLRLPPGEEALRKRLHRLNRKRARRDAKLRLPTGT
jgi:hypothetical protein